jgi:SSS family solute:Na+ symporter
VHTFPSVMAQNFYIAIFAWTTCFVVTALVSLATRPKTDDEMRGLVMGLTEIPTDAHEPWFRRPGPLAVIVGVALVIVNVVFW